MKLAAAQVGDREMRHDPASDDHSCAGGRVQADSVALLIDW